MRFARGAIAGHEVELTAAAGVVGLSLAVMSGPLLSIDGLAMWRQALAITYHGSWTFVPPIWWGSAINSSSRGVGASLQYLPSLLVFPWLSGHVPVQPTAQYDYRLFYADVLYVVAGAPVWALVTAVTAYLVALTARALGLSRRPGLWAMAMYGLARAELATSHA